MKLIKKYFLQVLLPVLLLCSCTNAVNTRDTAPNNEMDHSWRTEIPTNVNDFEDYLFAKIVRADGMSHYFDYVDGKDIVYGQQFDRQNKKYILSGPELNGSNSHNRKYYKADYKIVSINNDIERSANITFSNGDTEFYKMLPKADDYKLIINYNSKYSDPYSYTIKSESTNTKMVCSPLIP